MTDTGRRRMDGRTNGRGGDRRSKAARDTENRRWNEVFERNHGEEERNYYAPREVAFGSALPELCRSLHYLCRS